MSSETENILNIARRVTRVHNPCGCVACVASQLADAVERMTEFVRMVGDCGWGDEADALLRDLGIPLTEDGDE